MITHRKQQMKKQIYLERQVKELEEHNHELSAQLDEMTKLNGELRRQLDEYLNADDLETIDDISEENRNWKPHPAEFKRKSRSNRFRMVTVLFSDIQGFTNISKNGNSEILIDELDRMFYFFDNVIKKYNIEKIKTIGDAYMCAGGIPTKNSTNAIEMVWAAMEMQQYMKQLKERYKGKVKSFWELRLGIHTGPVTAEIIGKRKVNYDLKGTTVHIATRMQASSEPGIINISAMTFELVKDFFRCEYRGRMPIKYKGNIDMYFVKGFRPEFSLDGKGQVCNDLFKVKLALIRFDDLHEIVLDILEKELPKDLIYHNLKHTIDVSIEVEIIGRGENVSEEEILLLKTAALFHDSGFIRGYDYHEEIGVQIAKEILPRYCYSDEQISKISELILATKLPPHPTNLLEQIMCDADLDYLGRRDFIPVSNTLYKELSLQNKITSLEQWNLMQIKFLEGHQYFTETAKNMREVNKQKQLENIRALVNNSTDTVINQ
jgi:adenylate cyclase